MAWKTLLAWNLVEKWMPNTFFWEKWTCVANSTKAHCWLWLVLSEPDITAPQLAKLPDNCWRRRVVKLKDERKDNALMLISSSVALKTKWHCFCWKLWMRKGGEEERELGNVWRDVDWSSFSSFRLCCYDTHAFSSYPMFKNKLSLISKPSYQ